MEPSIKPCGTTISPGKGKKGDHQLRLTDIFQQGTFGTTDVPIRRFKNVDVWSREEQR